MSEKTYDDPVLTESGTWVVDNTASYVHFEVLRWGGLFKVTGMFERFDGAFVVDSDTVDAELTIQASSVHTGNAFLDSVLRSGDFLDVAHHPTIRFEVASVDATVGGWVITGGLAICDRCLHLQLPVTVFGEPDRLTALARGRMPRPSGRSRLGIGGSDVIVRTQISLRRSYPCQ